MFETEHFCRQEKMETNWAIVEMMGHAVMAGRMSEIGGAGGLTRLDVPDEGSDYETHYFSAASVYHITLVTEEVARMFVEVNPPPRPWRGSGAGSVTATRLHNLEMDSRALRRVVGDLANKVGIEWDMTDFDEQEELSADWCD